MSKSERVDMVQLNETIREDREDAQIKVELAEEKKAHNAMVDAETEMLSNMSVVERCRYIDTI